jgi:Secretion system C-terminal sorting domain
MKKILLAMLLFGAIVFNSQAQRDCNNQCTYGPLQTHIYEICEYNYQGPNQIGFFVNVTGSSVYVMVNYRLMTCNGRTAIEIDGTVLFDDRKHWNQLYLDYGIMRITRNSSTKPCPASDPLGMNEISTFQYDAINALVAQIGAGTSTDIEMYYKGACNSLVKLAFPPGSYITAPLGSTTDSVVANPPSGALDTIRMGKADVYMNIPCDVACCKTTFKYTIVTTANYETYVKWVPTFSGGDDGSCGTFPLPDYSQTKQKLEANIKDPITGAITTTTGKVIDQAPCELMCHKWNAIPPPSFQTKVGKEEAIPLAFSAHPTLITDFIKFNSIQTISKVCVYDMSGKKIMQVNTLNNNELNTSELKNGMYFIQVYLANSEVKRYFVP